MATHSRGGEAIAVEFNYLIVPQNSCNNCSKQLQTCSEKRSHAGKCRLRLNLSRTIRPNCAWNSPRESGEREQHLIVVSCCLLILLCACVQRQKQKHRNAVTRIALFVFVRVFRIAKVEERSERSSSSEPSKSRYERWTQRERERAKPEITVMLTLNEER